ncbi:hypothetical protein NY2A_b565R [Paramecium bursaria Chlorella virus NY2A]|uniref:Uncharacterized protein b565R n=1 Tax=Paramecium bursaria Chlorella virus NY2A TaxID=46021 RepID=A7IX90_PBCVN|nr:hypothetical protein NY2A_b565R [Paramecium bursaria Chlorella virus NY2A]ABT14964.1 hypothetical protein NY2A_b565R [Paramecium bursaria Chlorella virus NY2A]
MDSRSRGIMQGTLGQSQEIVNHLQQRYPVHVLCGHERVRFIRNSIRGLSQRTERWSHHHACWSLDNTRQVWSEVQGRSIQV